MGARSFEEPILPERAMDDAGIIPGVPPVISLDIFEPERPETSEKK